MWPKQGIARHLVVIAVMFFIAIISTSNTLTTRYVVKDRSGFTLDSRYIIELDPRSRSMQWTDRIDHQRELFKEAAVDFNGMLLYQKPVDLKSLTERARELADPTKYTDFGLVNYFTKDYWWPKGISGLYRPLTSITYRWNFAPIAAIPAAEWDAMYRNEPDKYYQIHARSLRYFHWTNTLLHAVAASLVYFVILACTQRFWVAAFAAAMFCCHPITVESVANIIGRADIFGAIFVFTTLLLYIRSTKVSGLARIPWVASAVVAGTIGVFFKESALAAGPICVVWEVVYCYRPEIRGLFATPRRWFHDATVLLGDFLGASVRFAMAGWVWLLIPAAAMFYMRSLIFSEKEIVIDNLVTSLIGLEEIKFGPSTPPEEPFLDNPVRGHPQFGLHENKVRALVESRVTSMKVITLLTGKLIWPVNLSSDYSYNQLHIYSSTGASWGAAMAITFCLGALALGGWALYRRANQQDNRGQFAAAGVAMGIAVILALWRVLPWATPLDWDDLWTLMGALIVMAFFIGAFVLWARGYKSAAFMIFFFFVALLPTANIVKVIGSIMAERFMYLPLLGFVGGVSLLVFHIFDRLSERANAHADSPLRYVPHGFFAIVLCLFTARTFARNYAWQSDEALWERAKVVSPNSFRSYQSYAFAIYENGKIDLERKEQPLRNLLNAEAAANRIINDASSSEVDKRMARANLEAITRELEPAKKAFDEQLAIYKTQVAKMIETDERGLQIVDKLPHVMNSARLYLHLGMYYCEMGKLVQEETKGQQLSPEARKWYEKAVAILERAIPIDRAFNQLNRRKEMGRWKPLNEIPDAGLAPVYVILGDAQLRLGRTDDAVATFEYMQRLDPMTYTSYLQIGVIRLNQSRVNDAIINLIQSVIIDPSKQEAWPYIEQIYRALGEPSAVSYNGEQRQINASVPLVRQHVADAMKELIRTMLKAKQVDFARNLGKQAIDGHGVPRGVVLSMFEDAGVSFDPPPKETDVWR